MVANLDVEAGRPLSQSVRLGFADISQERRYLDARDQWLRVRILYIGILAAVVFVTFLFVDSLLTPGQFGRLGVLRVTIALLLVAIGVIARARPAALSTSTAGILLAVVVYAGLYLSRVEIGLDSKYEFTGGAVLIQVGCWFLGSLTFAQAAVINAIAFLLWILLEGVIIQVPTEAILQDTIYLLATGAVCGFAAWNIERLFRKNFTTHEALAAQEQASRNRAMRDGLTGLWNRAAMEERIEAACRRAGVTGAGGAVFMIDLDRFKPVNDRYGHRAGDEVLIAIARRIQSALRPSDSIGRMGGDEFLVLVEDLSGADIPGQLAERIRSELESPIRVRLHGDSASVAVTVGASIGIGLFSGAVITPDQLIHGADVEMYRDKARRKGTAAETR